MFVYVLSNAAYRVLLRVRGPGANLEGECSNTSGPARLAPAADHLGHSGPADIRRGLIISISISVFKPSTW